MQPGNLTRNHLIDGWRGASVLAVIVGHLTEFRFASAFNTDPLHALIQERAGIREFASNIFFRVASPVGEVGVSFFFVISGYLITSLLIKEESKFSRINIWAFYVRRFFRIMPAFYLFIATVILLRSSGIIALDNGAIARSAAYVCNISEFKCSWWLAHTWSLSVEEQFYVVWPMLFVMFGQFRREIITNVFTALLVLSLFHISLIGFSCIALGAAVATSELLRDFVLRLARPAAIWAALVLVVVVSPLAQMVWWVSMPIRAVQPLLIALIFFGTLNNVGPCVPVVSFKPLQAVGLISYSLYLWQQLATAPEMWGGLPTGATTSLLSLLFLAPAIFSYFLIEKPMIAIGHRISERMLNKEYISPAGKTNIAY